MMKADKKKRQKVPSQIERLLTPFTSDKLVKADPFCQRDDGSKKSDDEDDDERDSSEIKEQ